MNAHQRRKHRRAMPKAGDRVMCEYWSCGEPMEAFILRVRTHSAHVAFIGGYDRMFAPLRSLRRLP